MFYSRTVKNLALANMTVSDGVSPSPKERGGAGLPPSKSANAYDPMGIHGTPYHYPVLDVCTWVTVMLQRCASSRLSTHVGYGVSG